MSNEAGPLLELRHVGKSFGGLRSVADLDLEVREGEIVSVIGPNGAGKTTVFNLVTGIYVPDEGEILLEGRDITGVPPHRIAHLSARAAAAAPDHSTRFGRLRSSAST
jgi:branched-chain amino acid transport system ATP-binding protein